MKGSTFSSKTLLIPTRLQSSPTLTNTVSANGAVLVPESSPEPLSGASAGRFFVQYSIPGHHVKSVFFRLGLKKGGWHNFSLYSIQFYTDHIHIRIASQPNHSDQQK
jgi:hypothetical protein